MSNEYKMLINGEWLSDTSTIDVVNPLNNDLLGTVPKATQSDVNAAIESARRAFPVMSSLPAHQRSKILETTSQLLEKHAEELAELIASEAGKAWKYAIGEVGRAVQTFKFAAEEAKQIHGETVPMDAGAGSENRMGFYLRFPIGVIGAITPFNFPLNLVAHKVAPALAAGNSVVLKPATATPLTALRLGELLMQAGLPAGALNIIMGGGATVGDWLVTDPRVAMISFTGSPPVGKYIISRGGLKKYTMELGSNSAVIICEDANIEKAVPRCIVGAFANSGQVCISVQRIYVHQRKFEAFLTQFLAATQQQVVGDAVQKNCDVGPLINEHEAERVEDWIKEAVAAGAEVLTGGTRSGTLFQPTVLTRVKAEMKVMRDEIFGPVVSIIPYENFEEVLNWVDDSKYGLQAGIYTNDLNRAFAAVKKIDVGGIIINDVPTYRVDHMPYGGNKESGIGREGLKYAIEEMTNIRMVVLNL
ncbi:aldehyde dehydrogenase family protein [candidate division KSB1 bacterium]|nr:aldehyde dehydrogenase family protein [candidate division KSB1 bacterium]